MAATEISATAMGSDGTYDIINGGDISTLGIGSAEGVYFRYAVNDIVFLYNDTGGTATFTILSQEDTDQTNRTLTMADQTVSVPDGEIHRFKPDGSYQTDSNNDVHIECDVAGKVLVLQK